VTQDVAKQGQGRCRKRGYLELECRLVVSGGENESTHEIGISQCHCDCDRCAPRVTNDDRVGDAKLCEGELDHFRLGIRCPYNVTRPVAVTEAGRSNAMTR
jgi:hypothetical protein